MTPFSKLTPAQMERLDILAEECAEVIQAVSKIKRHGFFSCHPHRGLDQPNNTGQLELELGDVLWAIDKLVEQNEVSRERIEIRRIEKEGRSLPYLHHQ